MFAHIRSQVNDTQDSKAGAIMQHQQGDEFCAAHVSAGHTGRQLAVKRERYTTPSNVHVCSRTDRLAKGS